MKTRPYPVPRIALGVAKAEVAAYLRSLPILNDEGAKEALATRTAANHIAYLVIEHHQDDQLLIVDVPTYSALMLRSCIRH
jgi:hypothetical protein